MSNNANAYMCRVLRLEPGLLAEHHVTISAVAEFCAWMLWFYVCDRTSWLPFEAKSYSRDTVAAIFAALVIAAFAGSIKVDATSSPLSRHQTEEWKGWMQVRRGLGQPAVPWLCCSQPSTQWLCRRLRSGRHAPVSAQHSGNRLRMSMWQQVAFLLYHYFAAAEAYNAVRVLIAAYVFLTGYGNFQYYHSTGDYSFGRFAQMLWRLNFLPACACVVLHNRYMLYYVCGMHTLFTLLVYATLGVARRWNASVWGVAGKLALAVALVVLVWDVPGVFRAIWAPLTGLVGYRNPRKPAGDVLHGAIQPCLPEYEDVGHSRARPRCLPRSTLLPACALQFFCFFFLLQVG